MFFTPDTPATNKIVTVPAPIGGINARDSLAAMPDTDALYMRNFWPQPYGVSTRKGYQEWATEMPDIVKTIAVWSDTDGTRQMVAFSGDGLYDITTRGPVGPPLLTGLSNSAWQLVGLSNAAGGHLIAVNGADDAILYNSAGIQRITAGNGTDPNTWSGIDPKDAIQLALHQSRIWIVPKDSTVAYYLPPDALYGVTQSIDFGPLFQRAGYIAFISTWTIDDGNGAEDHLVVVSSTGSAVVYAGGDPADDLSWRMVGVYVIGAPVLGRRCYAKVGGDLLILTKQGVVSMTGQLVSTKVNEKAASITSDKIQYIMSDLTTRYADYEGWQLAYHPAQNMVIVNVPTSSIGGNFQMVCNQLIGAWSEFVGMDAFNWNTFDEQPFFGGFDGRVFIAWYEEEDGALLDGTGGNSIQCECLQAYSYLGALGQVKQVGMFRPNFLVRAQIRYRAEIRYDWKIGDNIAPSGIPKPQGAVWNTAIWNQSYWYGAIAPQRQWVQAQGWGTAAAIAIGTQSSGETMWVSTDYSYQVGGLL